MEEQGIAKYARSPDGVIPGDAAKDYEYMCLIGLPSCKISITWFKVPITPKYFFRENESLHLFERHCGHQKGSGAIPDLMSQSTLHAFLQRVNAM